MTRNRNRFRPAVWAAPVLTLAAWSATFAPPLATGVAWSDVVWAVPFTVFSVIGAVIVAYQHTKLVGWIVSGIGLAMALAALEVAVLRAVDSSAGGHAVARWLVLAQPFGLIGYGLIVLLVLTFPDGRLPTRRWRMLVFVLFLFLLLVAVDQAVSTQPGASGLPVGAMADPRISHVLDPLTSFDLNGALLFLAGCGLLSRYRTESTVGRQQIKWFAVATTALISCAVAGGLADAVAGRDDLRAVLQSTGLVCFACGIGVAVVKHRLYDVDLVISRGVTYLVLVGGTTLLYIVMVVGLGSLVGGTTRSNLVLSVTATAVIAVVFHPAQRVVQQAANRLVFGRTQTPYDTLTSFTRHLTGNNEAETLVQQMADAVALGARAEAVGIHLIDDATTPVATSPPGEGLPARSPEHSMAVTHLGEPLGTLSVWTRPGLPLNHTGQRLIGDLAFPAGLLLHNARLTAELGRRIDELRSSRQRLVATQDAERRRLERDLHDGAQHDLVALRMKLGLAEREAGPTSDGLAVLLAELREDTGRALENIRHLSRGLYPPLLESQGLTAALTAHARRLPLRVDVVGGPHRFTRGIETAVYFCCVEALQNTIKHAKADRAGIRLSSADGRLHVSVRDDGHGFDPDACQSGTGLQNLTDRVEALTGTLHITTGDTGTTITADIPAQQV